MGLFRRGAKPDVDDEVVETQSGEVGPSDEPETDVDLDVTTVGRPRGPWDADDVDDEVVRVDLGALRLPGVPGMELRMEIDKATNVVSAATVLLDGSSLQVQAFAAPRTDGIWDEIRSEIAESVTQQGGSADDLPGPFGRELLARLPIRTPEGRTGHRPARFIGTDGPRWFLRGVVTGKAAVEPEAARALEQVFSRIVVVRGTDARPPRDLLPLSLPGGGPVPGPPVTPEVATFDPLTRGPEITEIR
ncbi:DUF3710 domain-containing protein [Cellulomonas soli]|uniref:DUF3710 domain-containing protein n=1 Tax=Cellulomonas soli TaxID=931535 RepID=A0A512P9V3_9CELL|nr:DUF3710 domain-containing protein [Cellulomonas soli]NYI60466.1 hypothetical protein [Cellulomonas soli]GEP67981.1 hypothetical protein CSO01_06960 [Cellulomonas soli]